MLLTNLSSDLPFPVNSETDLIFPCPHCRTPLRVPSSFAGVTGPCPQCFLQITAPLVSPTANNPTVQSLRVAALPTADSTTTASAPKQGAGYFDEPPLAESIRPEPRGIAPRSNSEGSVHLPAIDTKRVRTAESADVINPNHLNERPSDSRSLIRLAIPLLILALIGFGLFLLNDYLKSNSLTQPSNEVVEQKLKSHLEDPVAKPTAPIKPVIATPAQPEKTIEKPITESPFSPVMPPDAIKVSPQNHPQKPQQDEPQVGVEASRVVEQFLSATSFNERMLYVHTHLSQEDLQRGILNYKWPTAHYIPGSQIPHPAERLIEFYYEVSFGENSVGFPRKATLLVHKRANEEPKVILEPLLDTVGGRLRQFAKEPSIAPQDFYVIMDARSKCFDDNVPGADKKSTFYLRAHITGPDIATAYANDVSETRKEFDNPLTGLKWKNPMPVIVTLQWNIKEDHSRPFLEVIQIKAKSWNP